LLLQFAGMRLRWFETDLKDTSMAVTTKVKAEERFASIQKRDQAVRQDIENAARVRTEKMARLRQLRLAKEAEDAAAKAKEVSEKPVKKTRARKAPAAKGKASS
jgi:hypothetical protein